MASPVVAGVAALILSINPGMDAKALRDRFINTANPAIYESGGYNDQFYYPKVSTGERIPLLGSGIVDALAALKDETREVPSASGKNRVAPGCSAVSGLSQTFSWFFLFLLIPIFAFLPIRTFKSRSH
jgi:subtilisin family serine protease